jgi:hypothetical protein
MGPPHGFASYRSLTVEIWEDEGESFWAFVRLEPVGARRTHHPTGIAMPVWGGPWANRKEVIEAAKAACEAARAADALHAVPRCRVKRPGRLGNGVGMGPGRAV